MTTGTVLSSCRSGTAAVMTQSEQTAEGHSTLEQQPPGTLYSMSLKLGIVIENMDFGL